MNQIKYHVIPIQQILTLTRDSETKINKILQLISNNLSRVQTCMNFDDLVTESIKSQEIYIKLYVVFIYMLRDPVFFDEVCRELNDYAKKLLRQKLDDLKRYILGLHQQIGDTKETWKFHLGVYISTIQCYCLHL